MLAPAAWLKGGSWRMAADEPPRAAAPVASDARLAGFGIEDHMALGQWREARANAWRTRSAAHNAMPEDERRLALWDKIEGYRPLVARFLLAHEPAGTEQGESLPV
ncbi:hypothetical protein GT370_07300 [Acidocella sp. MX-AZ03]|nr:hypothetical protein [Acidocella sp. MX-AZ03]WBO60569.1 hypothetical protein GT370_07300 [Acidocella sp. MX-AZ03]